MTFVSSHLNVQVDAYVNFLGNVTVLLHTVRAEKPGEGVDPADMALVSMRLVEEGEDEIHEEDEGEWSMTLIELKGAETELLIMGDTRSTRSEAAEGFMARVEYMVGRKVGKGHAWAQD
jgi:hypothetical protein